MKVLIIGSKGFIGSHLLEFYHAIYKTNIYHCDVFSIENDTNYFKLNLENPDFDFVFKNNQFDICINASGAGNVGLSLTHPLDDFTLNTYNIIKVLEGIRKFNRNCKFINISSAAVYGSSTTLPISENHPLQPLSPYGFHKVFAGFLSL